MKKFFTLAALVLSALTINAQTTISFSEVKAAGSLNGQTITSTLDGFSLTVTDTKGKVVVDENEARFGTVESNTAYAFRLKSGGKSSSANCISIAVPSSGTLEICVRTGKNGETDRNLVLTQEGRNCTIKWYRKLMLRRSHLRTATPAMCILLSPCLSAKAQSMSPALPIL